MFALDTEWQRLRFFAVLYVCEGIPQGFTETFLPTHFAEASLSDGAIGDFGFWDSQPWAWKWALAPLVDILFSKRVWLFWTQALMALALLPLLMMPDLKAGFEIIKVTILMHNTFSATQDVAIDAIAVGALPIEEGPMADGIMFAAQEFGNFLGGSAALFVSAIVGYHAGCFWDVILLGVIFFGFTCRLHPHVGAAVVGPGAQTDGFHAQFVSYLNSLRQALFGPGGNAFWLAVFFACFPSGALLLRGPHCKSAMVADGLQKEDIANIEAYSKFASIASMLAGGVLSHRMGARRLVGVAYLGTMMTNLAVATAMSSGLTYQSWLLSKIMFHLLHGLHVGPQMSLFRSCCAAGAGATQFTMFCALCNNADSWGKYISGQFLETRTFKEGLPWDAVFVTVPLLLLPFVGRGKGGGHQHAE